MTKVPLREFDMQALCAALEAERIARGLTWKELVEQINDPFQHVPSLPISLSTIRGMQRRSSVTSAVVLQVLRWLQQAPESFLKKSHDAANVTVMRLPDVDPRRVLRFDTKALHAALDQKRLEQGLTWKQLAKLLPGFTGSMLTNLAAGPAIGFPRVMRLTQWLGQPAAVFVRGRDR